MRRRFLTVPVILLLLVPVLAQVDTSVLTVDSLFTYRSRSLGPVWWQANGSGYLALEPSPTKKTFLDIVRYYAATGERSVKVAADKLTPQGANDPLAVEEFFMTSDEQKLLIFTNTARVWRSNTRGDYWVLDLTTNNLRKLGGTDAKSATLMFAKFSPDGQRVGYDRENNIYVENLSGDANITKITTDESSYMVNGKFNLSYKEDQNVYDGVNRNPKTK